MKRAKTCLNFEYSWNKILNSWKFYKNFLIPVKYALGTVVWKTKIAGKKPRIAAMLFLYWWSYAKPQLATRYEKKRSNNEKKWSILSILAS